MAFSCSSSEDAQSTDSNDPNTPISSNPNNLDKLDPLEDYLAFLPHDPNHPNTANNSNDAVNTRRPHTAPFPKGGKLSNSKSKLGGLALAADSEDGAGNAAKASNLLDEEEQVLRVILVSWGHSYPPEAFYSQSLEN